MTAGTALGQVLGGVANTLDPDVIVLGGGAALSLGEVFIGAVRAGVADCVVRPTGGSVLTAQLGATAGVVGAGLVALDAFASQSN
jgi:glucokinase